MAHTAPARALAGRPSVLLNGLIYIIVKGQLAAFFYRPSNSVAHLVARPQRGHRAGALQYYVLEQAILYLCLG